MDRKLQLLETFVAHDDQGAPYKIFGYEHLVQVPLSGASQPQWEPTGLAEYKLAGGEHVDLERDGMLRVATSGLRLKRQ